jgi:prepilin-type N-terminal cleavage/methylation domain-containing protein
VNRSGFSLLEVLLATSILVGCLAVLFELAAMGRHQAEEAQQWTEAQALCETRLNGILAGLQNPDPIEGQTIEGSSGWQYSVTTEPLPHPGLLRLQVTVQEVVESRKPREFTLVQWIPAPVKQRAGDMLWPRPTAGPSTANGGLRP